jgi:predicted site-specific integrase-resolvase
MEGWAKIKSAARYAGVSERTMRDWLKAGLVSRLPSGTVLIAYADIDRFLRGFAVTSNDETRILLELCDEII